MYFPITCVDNFFDNPNKVRDLALSLDYAQAADGGWPGKRTELLSSASPEYFNLFSQKLFSLFYDFRKTNVQWTIETYFQLVTPYEAEKEVETVLNQGWVHADDNRVLAGVIYLTPSTNLTSGTSIYRPKTPGATPINNDVKHTLFSTGIATEDYAQKIQESNSLFEETLNVSSVYNRLICYDGGNYHKANNYNCGDEPRLTQVFFVSEVNANWFPIPNSKRIPL